MPHLLQKSMRLVFRQQTQTRCGLQDHRGPLPLIFWHCLLGNLQQLSDGVATLQKEIAICYTTGSTINNYGQKTEKDI